MTSPTTALQLIGHRGAVADEPENTLRSFRRAQRDGADWVELDLRLSADGQLMVVHDALLERTTNGSGAVAELTREQIQALDAGSGERVPTFEEVLAAVDLRIQAEIKAPEVVPVLAAMVERAALPERVVAASFSVETLAALADLAPGLPRALIFSRTPSDAVEQAVSVGARWLAPRLSDLTPELLERCAASGLRVDGWPVNTAEHLRRALELGIEAVTTDVPGLLRGWLTEGAAAAGYHGDPATLH